MIGNYFKTASRILINNKTFSLINIFGLAIGMAAFLTIFNYIVFETSYDAFHENADYIYRVRNDRIYEDTHDKSAGCPPAVGPTLKKEFPEVLEYARLYGTSWMNSTVTYIPGGDYTQSQIASPTRLVTFNEDKIYFADVSFLKMFSFPMVAGSDSALDDADAIVLTEASSRRYFGREDPMGKMIAVSNNYGKQLYKVTGLLKDIPENSHVKFDFLISYRSLINLDSNAEFYWGWNAFNTFILLAPDTDPLALQAKFPGVVEKYKNYAEDYRREYLLQPLKSIHLYSNLRFEPEVNGDAKTIKFLIAIALFILLIAWANYINLSTARSLARAKEVGVRKALGSQRLQLIKQFIFESLLFNFLAVGFAGAMVALFLPYFSQLSGKPLSLFAWSDIWFWLGLSVVVGAFLSGLYPAFILSAFDPVTVLARKSIRSSRGINLRKFLVIFQFALSIFLIASTLIVFNQLTFLRNRDLGFDLEQTLVVKAPRLSREIRDLAQRFKNELLTYPSILDLAVSTAVPGREYSNAASGIRPLNSNPEDGERCFFIDVDDKYFDLYGIEFAAGRNFSQEISADNEAVILNEEAVKLFGYDSPQSALNHKILFGGLGGQIRETVGVIKNYHHKSLKNDLQPIIFNFSSRGYYYSIKLIGENAGQVISLLQSKWQETFPAHPLEYFFLDESFNNQYRADTRFGKVFGLFAVLAIFVSCLGLFGLASFIAEQRTKEIGIRKVLGASTSGIVFFLSKEFTRWVILANLVAWPIAFYAMKSWLQNFAYRININGWVFIIAGVAALTISLLTVGFQAIKAAVANPIDSLRYE